MKDMPNWIVGNFAYILYNVWDHCDVEILITGFLRNDLILTLMNLGFDAKIKKNKNWFLRVFVCMRLCMRIELCVKKIEI